MALCRVTRLNKFKQVIVVNETLKLPRGKLAAQVAHASVGSLLLSDRNHLQAWLAEGMPKVVLAGNDEAGIVACHENALAAKIATQLIRDAGRTVIAAGTITCVGIGPALCEEIDRITAHLKLLR
jgi:peptidyl-tRNA hydrolase, PTH2 family